MPNALIVAFASMSVPSRPYGRIRKILRCAGKAWGEAWAAVVWAEGKDMGEVLAAEEAGGSPCMRTARFHRAGSADQSV